MLYKGCSLEIPKALRQRCESHERDSCYKCNSDRCNNLGSPAYACVQCDSSSVSWNIYYTIYILYFIYFSYDLTGQQLRWERIPSGTHSLCSSLGFQLVLLCEDLQLGYICSAWLLHNCCGSAEVPERCQLLTLLPWRYTRLQQCQCCNWYQQSFPTLPAIILCSIQTNTID